MSGKKKNDSKNEELKLNESKKELTLKERIVKTEREIIDQSIMITNNETNSCYILVIKTKELLKLRLMDS